MNATETPIGPEQRFRLAADLLLRRFGETGLLVDLNSDQIYELNETGFRVAELLDGQRSLADVVALLAQEYEADEVTLHQDVEALIRQLVAQGVIVVA